MNVSKELQSPLDTFVVDVPANQYYDFELAPDSTYPLKGVTYPVDYGNIPGYTAEDSHELDFFIGNEIDGKAGSILVDRGPNIGHEHKFYAALTEDELTLVLQELKPVLIEHQEIANITFLLDAIEIYKDTA